MNAYFDKISRLKYSNRGGYKAPHKAIYLLSIIDMIESGYIEERRFHITQQLVRIFELNWKRYVGNSSHFICNIWNPVNYMELEVIRRKFRRGCENVKPASIERCQEVYEYLEIPKDL
jgi:putative restriction endonuclease